ncbi:MAG TPA: 4Fe-4S dicluster domain-containing protein [Chloroflexota bacterium]|nr:4Fe-4S dicluster domain-containing protein [Chloroflexota bacterium]
MTFHGAAEPLIRHGHARRVEAAECLELLQQAYDHKLVQFGENVREGVSFICNCCGCCCEAMLAAKRFGMLHPVHTTNFLPAVDADLCSGCGSCTVVCPVNAMQLVAAGEQGRLERKRAQPDETTCLGCGVCVRSCPSQGIRLESRAERVVTPVNSVHRIVAMAIERGKLQNLIFDEQAMASHRAMAAILGVILKLPPIQQLMASRQMKSRYLEALLRRIKV